MPIRGSAGKRLDIGSIFRSSPMPADTELAELNRRIIEAMPGGIVHVSPEGAILAANPESQRILGLSLDAITKRYVQDWDPETIWEDGSPCPVSDYPVTRALVTGKKQPPTTIGVRRPDGTIAWALFTAVPVLSSTGTVSGAIVTFLDITAHKEGAMALRRSEELLRSVLDSAPNPIATTDREGRILLLSKRPAKDAPELVGLPAWTGLVPEDQELAKAAFQRVMETGEWQSYESVGAASRIRWLVHLGPRREAGEIVGATYVAWDITKMKELESRLAIADRMASIGTLAAGVAHEINNPLTYLLANLHWVRRQADEIGDPKMRERLDAILEAAERIRSVVADLGSFSHTSEGRKVLLDVRPLLDAAVRMAINEIRCRARVVTRYEDTPPVIASDGRLGQVFLNLVVNAAQAIPEGDIERNTITISTGTDEQGRAVVEVSDTGVGVSPEMVDKIFDPFITTKARGVGTGLGLYICKNVVTSLGGELGVVSVVGQGTSFRVSLPAASGTVRQAELPIETKPPTSGKRLRILVADDETSIATVMRTFLVDHDVEIVKTGREAIERLSNAEFDLAFCDLVMPDLTGMDVYEHLRKRHPGREERLIFMTGGAFTERTRKFLETVPNEVLDKPFTLRDIAGVVARRAG
jgi:PAS domain S-box-containing protein